MYTIVENGGDDLEKCKTLARNNQLTHLIQPEIEADSSLQRCYFERMSSNSLTSAQLDWSPNNLPLPGGSEKNFQRLRGRGSPKDSSESAESIQRRRTVLT